MASAIKRVSTPVLRSAFRSPASRQLGSRQQPQCQRLIHTNVPLCARQQKDDGADLDFSEDLEKSVDESGSLIDPAMEKLLARFERVDPATQKRFEEIMTIGDRDEDGEEVDFFDEDDMEMKITSMRTPPQDSGFWAEGENDVGPDEDFHGDDISSIAHEELETHRELREYARVATWELPLLYKLSKPFSPPPSSQFLRFRYTTYLGETHPAAHKVVVEFTPSAVPDLAHEQLNKLIKLAGARYNPSTNSIKIACELFDTQLQNKRWLLDSVNAMLKEARDQTDSFADVPFDFRHHKAKQRFTFPKEWILTPERKKQLEATRAQRLLADEKRLDEGKLLDGSMIIGGALAEVGAIAQKVPQYIEPPEWYSGRRRFRR